MPQSPETTFRDWYLRRVSGRSFAIATSAPTAEVKKACQRWASALGWKDVGFGTGPLVFTSGWHGLTLSAVELQVSTWEADGTTEARFVVSARWNTPGYEDDLEEAARRVAEGVDLELRDAGFAVSGAWEQLRPSKRARLARAERWRRRVTSVALAGLIPASLAVWLLIGEGAVGFFVGLWIALTILTSEEVVHRRLLGMKATFFVVLLASMWTAVVVVLTPIFVFIAMGKL